MRARRQVDVANWAVRRAQNIEQMTKEVRRDDVRLFTHAADLCDGLSDLLRRVGDEDGALFAASIARQLEQRRPRGKKLEHDADVVVRKGRIVKNRFGIAGNRTELLDGSYRRLGPRLGPWPKVKAVKS